MRLAFCNIDESECLWLLWRAKEIASVISEAVWQSSVALFASSNNAHSNSPAAISAAKPESVASCSCASLHRLTASARVETSSDPVTVRRPSRNTYISQPEPLMERIEAVRKPGSFSGCLLLLSAGRTRDIAFFIYEIKKLVVAIDCVLNQDLRFTFSAFWLMANIALTIDEIQKLLVISLEVQFLDLFGHSGKPSVLPGK